MGGELHQCSPVCFQAGRWQTHFKTFLCTSRGVKCNADCEVCWCGPTSFARLPRMPVEVLCRRFAAPLFVTIILTRCEDRRGIFFLFILSGFSRPLCCTVCSFRCGPHSSLPCPCVSAGIVCPRHLPVLSVVLTRCGGRREIFFPAYIEMDLIGSSFPAFFFLSACAALFVQVMFIRRGMRVRFRRLAFCKIR